MNEEWRDVPGFGGHYQASSLGRVRSRPRLVRKPHKCGRIVTMRYPERVLTPTLDRWGYGRVHLGVDGRTFSPGVHQLVALAFHGERPPEMECRHLDGDKANNRASNLAWGTHLENNRDRLAHGTYRGGHDHPMAKHSAELLAEIRAGKMTVREAEARGVSRTQYYRVKKAEAMRLADQRRDAA